MSDRDLRPIPIEVEAYLSLISNPLGGAALLGIPFGLLAYGAASFGLLPLMGSPELSPVVTGVCGWIGGTLATYLMLSKPY